MEPFILVLYRTVGVLSPQTIEEELARARERDMRRREQEEAEARAAAE